MPFKDPPKPPETRTIELEAGQYTPIPNSTKVVLFGPAIIKITRWPDGGIDGTVVEGKTALVDVAVRQRLQRVPW